MKTLSKKAFNDLVGMIKNGDKLNWIKSYCEGYGLSTENPSSPVFINKNKISITYRRVNSYYYL